MARPAAFFFADCLPLSPPPHSFGGGCGWGSSEQAPDVCWRLLVVCRLCRATRAHRGGRNALAIGPLNAIGGPSSPELACSRRWPHHTADVRSGSLVAGGVTGSLSFILPDPRSADCTAATRKSLREARALAGATFPVDSRNRRRAETPAPPRARAFFLSPPPILGEGAGGGRYAFAVTDVGVRESGTKVKNSKTLKSELLAKITKGC